MGVSAAWERVDREIGRFCRDGIVRTAIVPAAIAMRRSMHRIPAIGAGARRARQSNVIDSLRAPMPSRTIVPSIAAFPVMLDLRMVAGDFRAVFGVIEIALRDRSCASQCRARTAWIADRRGVKRMCRSLCRVLPCEGDLLAERERFLRCAIGAWLQGASVQGHIPSFVVRLVLASGSGAGVGRRGACRKREESSGC